MASISFDEKCSVVLSDHAKHLSIACNELFEQQTFSDVTLAAEDYRFDGHRLVLVAFSPYFQQMLTNVPANQHTIGKTIGFRLAKTQLIAILEFEFFNHSNNNSVFEGCSQANAL